MKAGVIMKKTMKKLVAAMLTLACVPVTGMTAQALAHPPATWDMFDDAHLIKDDGYAQLYVKENANGINTIYYVTPRTNNIRLVFREDLDLNSAAEQAADVLETFFPGIKEGRNGPDTLGIHYNKGVYSDADYASFGQPWESDSTAFDLFVNDSYLESSERSAALEADILLALAQHGLISEFYGFGETAQYGHGYLHGDILQECFPYYQVDADKDDPDALHSGEQYWKEIPTDWDEVRAYLAEHYPDYTVEQYEKQYNGASGKTYTRYRINGIENLTLYEKVDLAEELRVKFHVTNGYPYSLKASEQSSTTGHNALEHPGDTNLDCEVDILDVIAANKHILGIGTLDKTGLKNADMDGNGTADTADSLAILKKALE